LIIAREAFLNPEFGPALGVKNFNRAYRLGAKEGTGGQNRWGIGWTTAAFLLVNMASCVMDENEQNSVSKLTALPRGEVRDALCANNLPARPSVTVKGVEYRLDCSEPSRFMEWIKSMLPQL